MEPVGHADPSGDRRGTFVRTNERRYIQSKVERIHILQPIHRSSLSTDRLRGHHGEEAFVPNFGATVPVYTVSPLVADPQKTNPPYLPQREIQLLIVASQPRLPAQGALCSSWRAPL